MSAKGSYYLPEPSAWPVITSAAIFVLALGYLLYRHRPGAAPMPREVPPAASDTIAETVEHQAASE